jgi:hypothetical protein
LKAFKNVDFDVLRSLYKVDALVASQSDLEDLFDLFLSYKNVHGESPVITANAIMANPDFNRIDEGDFKTSCYERFTETFKHYPEHQNNLNIWRRGIDQKVFHSLA